MMIDVYHHYQRRRQMLLPYFLMADCIAISLADVIANVVFVVDVNHRFLLWLMLLPWWLMVLPLVWMGLCPMLLADVIANVLLVADVVTTVFMADVIAIVADGIATCMDGLMFLP